MLWLFQSMCVHLWLTQAGLHRLELNPYWKDGGTGLPPEEETGTPATKGSTSYRLLILFHKVDGRTL